MEGAKGGRCAVTRTPDNQTFLCVAVTRQLLLMQWYAPRKKFMKLKDFEVIANVCVRVCVVLLSSV